MNPAVLKGVLALHGGMPVRSKRLPAWPYFAEDEVAAIADVMRSGNVNYCTGEQGKAFEREFADACRTKHAVAVANGTVALELALRSVGIRSGDQVVTSSRTFCASASCIAMWGAIPVFADVDRDTNLARGFYIAAAVLAATGGGLLWWDLHTDSVGLQTHF